MCCNGTLYGRARVAEGEEPRILGDGQELLTDKDKNYFRLPCKFESCGRCTIYETRYEVCRTFTCALLRRYEAGEVTLDEAKRTVAEALDMRRKVVADHPQAGVFRVRQDVRARLAQDLKIGSPESRSAVAHQLLNIVALDAYLERWFRNKKAVDNEPQLTDESASNS